MKRADRLSFLVVFVLVPATLFLGTKIRGRWFYLVSTLVIIEIMLPFFFRFEARKPLARELAILAVMSALAAASRAAFAFLPYLKTITGIIMITGIAFGPEAGFLTGAIAAFASNFFFGQGPWTPWQMFAYGFGGFFAGAVFFRRRYLCRPAILVPFGFLTILCIVGPMLDSCTVFTMLTKFTPESVLFIYGQGVPVNLVHGVGCALTLALLTKPLLYKLNRLQEKYGMMEGNINQTEE